MADDGECAGEEEGEGRRPRDGLLGDDEDAVEEDDEGHQREHRVHHQPTALRAARGQLLRGVLRVCVWGECTYDVQKLFGISDVD